MCAASIGLFVFKKSALYSLFQIGFWKKEVFESELEIGV